MNGVAPGLTTVCDPAVPDDLPAVHNLSCEWGGGRLWLALFRATGLRCTRRTGVAVSSLRLDPHPAALRVFVHSDDEARGLENIVQIIRHSHA